MAPNRNAAIEKLVAGWAADVAKHDSVAMYAYRRANVAELNRQGREVWRSLGRLEGSELVAPGGIPYAIGDRVVTLAPAAGGKVVTSQTATVVALNVEAKSLSIRMDDDNEIFKLVGPEIAASRLAHAYAVTAHRSQGATVDRAHALEDGGGRELAYVKMSRAKERTSVYVVADSLQQATEDLRREWGTDRRLSWVIDTGTPMTNPVDIEASRTVARPMREALRHGRLVAERDAILAVIPRDPSVDIRAAELQRRRLEAEREDLAKGAGRYRDHPVAQALQELSHAESNVARLQRNLNAGGPRKDRRVWRSGLNEWRPKLAAAVREVAAVTATELARLGKEEQDLAKRLSALREQRANHASWTARHPEAERRLDQVASEIASFGEPLQRNPAGRDRPPRVQPDRWERLAHSQDRDLGLDLGR